MPKTEVRVKRMYLRWAMLAAAIVLLLYGYSIVPMALAVGAFLLNLLPQTAQAHPSKTKPIAPAVLKAVEDQAVPAIGLKRHWPMLATAAQNSWLGGLPRLPQDIEWPVNAASGLALHHLAQIDLAEMPALENEALPKTGTLWFFADIDEELVWDAGPDTPHSRVIYTDRATVDVPMRQAPDTLPPVLHQGGRMTRSEYADFPDVTVYPRWPVTGFVTRTWPSEKYPNDVDVSDYLSAVQAEVTKERAQNMGTAPQTDRDLPKVFWATYVPLTPDTDAGEGNFLELGYDPQAAGGCFPYSGAVAKDWLLTFEARLASQSDRAAYRIAFAEKKEKPSKPKDVAMRDILRTWQTRARGVCACDLEIGTAEIDALVAELQAAFAEEAQTLAAMSDKEARETRMADRRMAYYYLSEALHEAWERVVLRALQAGFDEPARRDALPDRVERYVIDKLHPAHRYTHHYLMGAKSSCPNPTAGDGIRLAQFDSDYGMGWMFCDVGIVDFWIDPKDLQAGRWDKAWAATAGG